MIGLILKQTTSDGRSKVWKLSHHKTRLTFGTSRKADLVSIDNSAESFHAVLELIGKQWYCITFETKDIPPKVAITDKYVLNLPHSRLVFEVQMREAFVLDQLQNIEQTGLEYKNLVLVTRNEQVLSTHLLDIGKNFDFYLENQHEQITLGSSDYIEEVKKDGFVIKSKRISVQDASELNKVDPKELWDADSRKSLSASLVLTLLIVGVSFLAPKSKETQVTQPTKAVSSNFVVKTPTNKKKKIETKTLAARTQASASTSANSGGGKSSALIKSAIGVRISQLLGKVSATEARTKNVILSTQGIKAGDAPSGRALAAVGKVEASGRNWNGESIGRGGGVGTVGSGGGKTTAGLGGGLGQGRTGHGGVGLIEEESEVVGGLDREVIAQYIKTQLGQILYCYERQLSASPDLFGKIAVKFIIAGTGSVETQSINDTTLKSSSVENCILNKVSKWKFPEPKGGTKVVVTYPFLFKSTN